MAVYIIKTDKSFEENLKQLFDANGEYYCGYVREDAFQKAILDIVDRFGGGVSVMKISEDEE